MVFQQHADPTPSLEKAPAVLEGRPPGMFYGYVIVAAAMTIFMVSFGVHYSFGVFFKPMSDEFGWSRSLTSGAFSMSWLLHGLASIFLGRFNDRYGPRLVLIASAIVLAGGYLLTTRVQSAWQFYLTYGVLVGIGTGGIYVPLVSTIARWYVVNRTRMTGIAVSGAGVGTYFIPLVANRLIESFNWRITFAILGTIVLTTIVLASLVLKRDPSQTNQLPDGIPLAPDTHFHKDTDGLSLREAMRTRQFWLICTLYFCFGFFTYAILVHISPYATDQGLTPITAANMLAVIGFASILGRLVLGQIGDWIGNRNIFAVGFLSVTVATSTILAFPAAPWVLYPFVVVIGLAYGGCSASHSPMVATFFGLKAHGQIIGVANNGYTIGATVGPFAAGFLFDLYGGYGLAFGTVALAGVVGLAVSIALKPIKTERGLSN